MTPAQIYRRRKNLNMTQDELAERLGYTGHDRRRTISRWETGEATPPPPAIILMKTLASK